MIGTEDLHEIVLEPVYVLELIYHNVLEALLPLELDIRIVFEDIERELYKIVVVEREAFFLLVEIAVKDYLVRIRRG